MRVSHVLVSMLVTATALSGCTGSGTSPTPPPAVETTPGAVSVKPCAVEQTGQAGLLTFNQVWPSADSAEGSARVVSLDATKCHQASDTVVCEQPFPWVTAQPDGLLGQLGAKLWGQAELTSTSGSRTQSLRQSIVLFATPQHDSINTLATRASACGLAKGADGVMRGTVKGSQEELHNLGRVQLVLEFTGVWKSAEVDRIRQAAIAAAKAL